MNPAGTHLEPFESVSCSGTTAPANASRGVDKPTRNRLKVCRENAPDETNEPRVRARRR